MDDLNAELEELSHDHDEEEAEDAHRTAEEIQADIDAANAGIEPLKAAMDKAAEDCLANVKEKTDEVYAKLEAGEDFNCPGKSGTYGEDPA